MDFSKIPQSLLDTLTLNEKLWLKYYLETRNKTEAAVRAFGIEDRTKASRVGETMSRRKRVRRVLNYHLIENENLAEMKLKEALIEEIFEKGATNAPERQVRIKAIELLMKMKGILPTGKTKSKEKEESWKDSLEIRMDDASGDHST